MTKISMVIVADVSMILGLVMASTTVTTTGTNMMTVEADAMTDMMTNMMVAGADAMTDMMTAETDMTTGLGVNMKRAASGSPIIYFL